jgi:hypothetical protein
MMTFPNKPYQSQINTTIPSEQNLKKKIGNVNFQFRNSTMPRFSNRTFSQLRDSRSFWLRASQVRAGWVFLDPCSHRARVAGTTYNRPGCLKQPFWKLETETIQPCVLSPGLLHFQLALENRGCTERGGTSAV